MKYEAKEYISSSDKPYYGDWFKKLAPNVAAKITTAVHKLAIGHESNTKFLQDGVWEYKINVGPGYRIYYGKVGKNVILLLAGGTKKEQQKDIKLAIALLKEYKKSVLH